MAPTHLNATHNLARAYAFLGDHEQAETYYRRAIEHHPDAQATYYNFATMLSKTDRDEEAVDLFREAVRLKPTHAEAWCNFSDALQDTGRFAEALAAIREGHRLGTARPEWSYPSAEWVVEAEELAELEARMEALLRGEETLPDSPTRLHFAKLLRIKSRYADAANVYRDAFAADPEIADNLAAGYRYAAAATAAQAAIQSSGEEQAQFIDLACQWLSADLELRRNAVDSGTREDRQAVLSKLKFWLGDERLTSIRDEAQWGLLSPPRQQACRQLWNEVHRLVARIEGTPDSGS